MNKNENKKIEELVAIVKEQNEQNKQLLIIARDSVAPSYSDVTLKLTEKVDVMTTRLDQHIEEHKKDICDMKEFQKRMEPMLTTYQDGTKLGKMIKMGFITVSGFIITLWATVSSYNNLTK